jgi:hypothetical protein
MEINIKSDKEESFKIKLQNFGKGIIGFWMSRHMIFFFIFFIAAILAGGFVWKNSLNGFGWSEEKKLEYINSQSKGVSLNEKEYAKVIEEVKAREEASSRNSNDIKDIFKAY